MPLACPHEPELVSSLARAAGLVATAARGDQPKQHPDLSLPVADQLELALMFFKTSESVLHHPHSDKINPLNLAGRGPGGQLEGEVSLCRPVINLQDVTLPVNLGVLPAMC